MGLKGPMMRGKILGGAGNALPLMGRDRRLRARFIGPIFHFDKNQKVAFAGNHIDFAQRALIIAHDKAISLRPQPP